MTKRITLISHEMTYTGAPRSLLNIAMVLRESNFEVKVWSLKHGDFCEVYNKNGFPVNIISKDWENDKNELVNTDIIIANTIFCAQIASILQHDVKVILYIREAQNLPDIIKNCNLDEKHVRESQHLVCVSEYAQEFINNKYSPKNNHVIHNFVKDEYRKKINVCRKNVVHFLIAGTIEQRKGLDIVIGAFDFLPDRIKKRICINIIGRKPDWAKTYWEGLIPEHYPNILYHGEIKAEDKRIELYEKMNVFIVASSDEACSLVALEGAMLGKCLLITKNVGAKYLIHNEKLLFDYGNSKQLSELIVKFTNPYLLLFYGILLRYKYKKTSTKKKFIKEFLKYIELIESEH